MAELTTAGLTIMTLGELRELINGAWRDAFGQSFDLSDRSPDGQLNGMYAERFALMEEVLAAIVASLDPDSATGSFLLQLCSLIGLIPPGPSFSTATVTLTGVPTTVVNAGSLISAESTGQQFQVAEGEDGTIVAATDWAPTTGYVVDDRVTNSDGVYLATVSGTSAGSGGPTGIDPDPDVFDTDGTVHWRFLGAGTGFVDVLARCKTTGPVVAVAGDLVNIDSAVGGWDGVVNILDATLGRPQLTDAQIRVLREQELARPGTSPSDAIRAALLEVDKSTSDPVTACTVFMNVDDVTDVDGVPPHSVEALVTGGSDQSIWDALLGNVAAGIRTYGSEVGTSLDSSGVAQTMKFSRTTQILIYVSVTLLKDPATYPADGDDQVKAAISAWGNGRKDGTDVVSAAVLAQVFSVTGVLDVSLPLISAAPVTVPVSTTTIVVSLRQRGAFDTTRITVASSDGSP